MPKLRQRRVALQDADELPVARGPRILPLEALPSSGIAIRSVEGRGEALVRLAGAFRRLPVPVIGTVSGGALTFDLRCLEDERTFVDQLAQLRLDAGGSKP